MNTKARHPRKEHPEHQKHQKHQKHPNEKKSIHQNFHPEPPYFNIYQAYAYYDDEKDNTNLNYVFSVNNIFHLFNFGFFYPYLKRFLYFNIFLSLIPFPISYSYKYRFSNNSLLFSSIIWWHIIILNISLQFIHGIEMTSHWHIFYITITTIYVP